PVWQAPVWQALVWQAPVKPANPFKQAGGAPSGERFRPDATRSKPARQVPNSPLRPARLLLPTAVRPLSLPIFLDAEETPMSNTANASYSKGLEGVVAGQTSICTVGRSGDDLRYRGYSIEDLCEKATWEEVAHLLVKGERPGAAQLDAWR